MASSDGGKGIPSLSGLISSVKSGIKQLQQQGQKRDGDRRGQSSNRAPSLDAFSALDFRTMPRDELVRLVLHACEERDAASHRLSEQVSLGDPTALRESLRRALRERDDAVSAVSHLRDSVQAKLAQRRRDPGAHLSAATPEDLPGRAPLFEVARPQQVVSRAAPPSGAPAPLGDAEDGLLTDRSQPGVQRMGAFLRPDARSRAASVGSGSKDVTAAAAPPDGFGPRYPAGGDDDDRLQTARSSASKGSASQSGVGSTGRRHSIGSVGSTAAGAPLAAGGPASASLERLPSFAVPTISVAAAQASAAGVAGAWATASSTTSTSTYYDHFGGAFANGELRAATVGKADRPGGPSLALPPLRLPSSGGSVPMARAPSFDDDFAGRNESAVILSSTRADAAAPAASTWFTGIDDVAAVASPVTDSQATASSLGLALDIGGAGGGGALATSSDPFLRPRNSSSLLSPSAGGPRSRQGSVVGPGSGGSGSSGSLMSPSGLRARRLSVAGPPGPPEAPVASISDAGLLSLPGAAGTGASQQEAASMPARESPPAPELPLMMGSASSDALGSVAFGGVTLASLSAEVRYLLSELDSARASLALAEIDATADRLRFDLTLSQMQADASRERQALQGEVDALREAAAHAGVETAQLRARVSEGKQRASALGVEIAALRGENARLRVTLSRAGGPFMSPSAAVSSPLEDPSGRPGGLAASRQRASTANSVGSLGALSDVPPGDSLGDRVSSPSHHYVRGASPAQSAQQLQRGGYRSRASTAPAPLSPARGDTAPVPAPAKPSGFSLQPKSVPSDSLSPANGSNRMHSAADVMPDVSGLLDSASVVSGDEEGSQRLTSAVEPARTGVGSRRPSFADDLELTLAEWRQLQEPSPAAGATDSAAASQRSPPAGRRDRAGPAEAALAPAQPGGAPSTPPRTGGAGDAASAAAASPVPVPLTSLEAFLSTASSSSEPQGADDSDATEAQPLAGAPVHAEPTSVSQAPASGGGGSGKWGLPSGGSGGGAGGAPTAAGGSSKWATSIAGLFGTSGNTAAAPAAVPAASALAPLPSRSRTGSNVSTAAPGDGADGGGGKPSGGWGALTAGLARWGASSSGASDTGAPAPPPAAPRPPPAAKRDRGSSLEDPFKLGLGSFGFGGGGSNRRVSDEDGSGLEHPPGEAPRAPRQLNAESRSSSLISLSSQPSAQVATGADSRAAPDSTAQAPQSRSRSRSVPGVMLRAQSMYNAPSAPLDGGATGAVEAGDIASGGAGLLPSAPAAATTTAAIVGRVMQAVPLFRSLDPPERAVISAALEGRRYHDHDLVAAGAPQRAQAGGRDSAGDATDASLGDNTSGAGGDAFFIVLEGTIVVLPPRKPRAATAPTPAPGPPSTPASSPSPQLSLGSPVSPPDPASSHPLGVLARYGRGDFFVGDALPPGGSAVAKGDVSVVTLRPGRLAALLRWIADARRLREEQEEAVAAHDAELAASHHGHGDRSATVDVGAAAAAAAVTARIQAGIAGSDNVDVYVAVLRRYRDHLRRLPMDPGRPSAHAAAVLQRAIASHAAALRPSASLAGTAATSLLHAPAVASGLRSLEGAVKRDVEQALRDFGREHAILLNGEERPLGSPQSVCAFVAELGACVREGLLNDASAADGLASQARALLARRGAPVNAQATAALEAALLSRAVAAIVADVLIASSRTVTGGDSFTRCHGLLGASDLAFLAAESSSQSPVEVVVTGPTVFLQSVNTYRVVGSGSSGGSFSSSSGGGSSGSSAVDGAHRSKFAHLLKRSSTAAAGGGGMQVWALLRCTIRETVRYEVPSPSAPGGSAHTAEEAYEPPAPAPPREVGLVSIPIPSPLPAIEEGEEPPASSGDLDASFRSTASSSVSPSASAHEAGAPLALPATGAIRRTASRRLAALSAAGEADGGRWSDVLNRSAVDDDEEEEEDGDVIDGGEDTGILGHADDEDSDRALAGTAASTTAMPPPVDLASLAPATMPPALAEVSAQCAADAAAMVHGASAPLVGPATSVHASRHLDVHVHIFDEPV